MKGESVIQKPSMIKRIIMSLVNGYRGVMDVKYNPLRHVLFTVWSVFFGLIAANYLGFFNYNTVISIFIHISILAPIAFTNTIFVDAERDGHKWLEEWKEERSRYNLVINRLKTKNLTIWNPKEK